MEIAKPPTGLPGEKISTLAGEQLSREKVFLTLPLKTAGVCRSCAETCSCVVPGWV